jgi:hypothetical protein
MSRRVLRRVSLNIFANSLTPWFLRRVLVSRLKGWADAWSEMLTPRASDILTTHSLDRISTNP